MIASATSAPETVLGKLVSHHRTVAEVLGTCGAGDGQILIDAHCHRWRVEQSRIGPALVGVGFECRLPPCLLKTVILVGLKLDPSAEVEIDEDTEPIHVKGAAVG